MIFNSKTYWESRYKNNRNSGNGSRGEYAEFKALIINEFIEKNNIEQILEFGCGDCYQASLININDYVGFDVSETIVKKCTNNYTKKHRNFFAFEHFDKIKKVECTMSLDVTYHIIEKDIYEDYVLNLFKKSNKYVILLYFYPYEIN